jgi:hypothetical protein
VRQLQQLSKPGSTTTSLRITASTGTRTATRTGTTGRTISQTDPATEIAHAEKLISTVIQKAPLRDLILGAATLVVLVFIGAQTKLLVTSPKVGVDSSYAAPLSPVGPVSNPAQPNSAKTVPSTPTGTSVVHSTSASVVTANAKPRKSRRPPTHPAEPIVVPVSNLDLAVQHQFKDATLFFWVDDNLMLTRALHGAAQKHLVVFNGLRGVESETLKIPAGKHVLRVRALSADETIDLSRTVSAEFIGGVDKSLQVTIDKHNTVMRLSWQ